MIRLVRLLGVACAAVILPIQASSQTMPIPAEDMQRTTPVDFQTEILPILRANCVACHNRTEPEAELVLETPEFIGKGGAQGPAVVAGQSEKSLLLRAAAHRDGELLMPPPDNEVGARQLTPRELGLLKLWIDQGAAGQVSSSRKIRWRPLPTGLQPIFATAVTPDGHFAACGRGNRLFVYNVRERRLAAELSSSQQTTSPGGEPLAAAHVDVIRSLAFDAAAERLASGGFRTVQLWRRPRVVPLLEYKAEVAITAASLSDDGRLAALGAANGKVVVQDLAANQQIAAFEAHADVVTGLAFTAEGKSLVSVSRDKKIKFWAALEGKALAEISSASAILAMTRVSASIVTGHEDKTIRVWDVPSSVDGSTGAKPRLEITGHSAPVTALDAGPDGQLLSGSGDGSVRHWDVQTGKQIRQFGHGAAVTAVAMTTDGSGIASAGGGRVKIFQNRDGSPVADWAGGPDALEEVASLEAEIAFTKSAVELAKRDIKAYEGPERRVKTTAEEVTKAEKLLAKAEKSLAEKRDALEQARTKEKNVEGAEKALQEATTARDVAITIVERAKTVAQRAIQELDAANASVAAGEAKRETLDQRRQTAEKAVADSATPIQALAFSPDGKRLVVCREQSPPRIYDAAGGPLRTIGGHQDSVAAVAFSADGRLLTGARDGRAIVFRVETDWALERTLGGLDKPELLGDRVLAVNFSPDGKLLATGGGLPSRSGLLKIWRVEDGQQVLDLADAHADTVFAVAFSPSGDYLASAGADRLVKVFRVADGELIVVFAGHTEHVLGVSWSGDGKLLVSCGGDKVLKLWDFAAKRPLQTMKGDTYQIGPYRREVTAAVFIGDSEQILAASGDGTVRLHRTSSQSDVLTFAGSTGYVYSAAASADGRALVAGGSDGVLWFWSGQDRSPRMAIGPTP